MPEFDTSHVKNVVLLGHAGSGKTTLAECMLYEAGLINRRGSIAEQNTVGDYHPLEQDRGNTIFSKLMHTKWRGFKINILDTPGYDDFVGEVLSALRVADTGVMVLNATAGVEVSTDTIWEYTEQFKTPMIFTEMAGQRSVQSSRGLMYVKDVQLLVLPGLVNEVTKSEHFKNITLNNGGLIGQAGGNVIATGGGNWISNNSGNVISTGGGNVISTGGLN